MDIIYKKDTLYVYLDEGINDRLLRNLENRISTIMSTYNISNLVIDTMGEDGECLEMLENRLNRKHRFKVMIK